MNISQKSQLIIIFLLVSFTAFGQKYLIEGTIRNSETHEPINAASIILKNSGRGTAVSWLENSGTLKSAGS